MIEPTPAHLDPLHRAHAARQVATRLAIENLHAWADGRCTCTPRLIDLVIYLDHGRSRYEAALDHDDDCPARLEQLLADS